MPRTSVSELMIKDSGLVADLARPDVPYDLDDEAAIEWRRIVNSMPADHFIPANYHMLGSLCQHIVAFRRISQLIRSYCKLQDRVNVKTYLELCKQRSIESAAILKFSRGCRITHQSTHNKTAVNLKTIAAHQVDMSEVPGWK